MGGGDVKLSWNGTVQYVMVTSLFRLHYRMKKLNAVHHVVERGRWMVDTQRCREGQRRSVTEGLPEFSLSELKIWFINLS